MNPVTHINKNIAAVEKINNLQKELASTDTSALYLALTMGELLIEEKKLHAFGQWGGWVEENLILNRSQVNNYMKLAENKELISNYHPGGNLNIKSALAFIKKNKPADKKITAGRKTLQALVDGEPVKSTGTATRARKIINYAPELVDKVLKNEASFDSAYEEAIHAKKKTPTDEQASEICDEIANIVDPRYLAGLSEYQRQWAVKEHQELHDLLGALNKSLTKKAITAYVRLLAYHKKVVNEYAFQQAPQNIKLLKMKLEKKEAELSAREKAFKKRTELLSQVISDADVKLIRGCLHPDTAPKEKRAKYNKAFAAFNTAI